MDILLIESTLFGGMPTTTAPAEVSDTLLQGLILLLSIRYIIFKNKRWDTSELLSLFASKKEYNIKNGDNLPNREQCPRRVQNDTGREAFRSTHPCGWGVPTIPISPDKLWQA